MITWLRSLSIWWLLLWRGLVGGLLIGFCLGFVIGAIGALVGWPHERIVATTSVICSLSGVVWSVFVVQMALRKRYRAFRLAVVPHESVGFERPAVRF